MISKGCLVRWKRRRRARGSTGGPHYNGIYLAISDPYEPVSSTARQVIDVLLDGAAAMINVQYVEEVQ
jgi:hypothetical protein